MQQIIINNTSGYLLKNFDVTKEDFLYLYDKKMIKELSSIQEKKYKSKYFLTEKGYLFLKLSDYDKRYNILSKYLNLRSNMNFMNKEYLNNLDNLYPSQDKNIKNPICFFKGQIYSLDSILEKTVWTNPSYILISKNKDYLIKNKENNHFILYFIYRNNGVYILKCSSKFINHR